MAKKAAPRYLLEVECPNNYSGQQTQNLELAWLLCEIAFAAGKAKMIKLSCLREASTDEVLFDSSNPVMVETMKQTLKLRLQLPEKPVFQIFQRN
jgi:hypothetical protein